MCRILQRRYCKMMYFGNRKNIHTRLTSDNIDMSDILMLCHNILILQTFNRSSADM